MYIPFPSDKLKLQQIYKSATLNSFKNEPIICSQISNIYGKFQFPVYPDSRPYTFGSFVHSIDGRIAFPNSPDGTLVAKKNLMDPDGALCDYWILNLLRAVSDSIVMGAKTIKREPELTGHIFDETLVNQRIKDRRAPVPLHIIATGSGNSIPLDHPIITSEEIPALILTSPVGRKKILNQTETEILDLGENPSFMESGLVNLSSSKKTYLLAIGKSGDIDINKAMNFLKEGNIHSMLVESPVFMNTLIKTSILDEIYLNTSGIYISGKGLSLGEDTEGFTTDYYPHTQLLSMHSHSDYFTYSRYRFKYDKTKELQS